MTTFEIPTVTTERLRLRAFQASDLDAYAAMQANPEVMRFLVDGRTHSRVEVWRIIAGFLGHWALRGYGMWACEKLESGRFMGSIGIFEALDWPEPELAYALDQPFWGQGFATEAATAARDWLFGHFPLARIASFIHPHNHASIRVAQRLGAVCEGTAGCVAPFRNTGCTTGVNAPTAWNELGVGLISGPPASLVARRLNGRL